MPRNFFPSTLILLTIFAVVYFLIACDTTEPPSEKPLGYQDDINWPSLADSPWPVYKGDMQNTGRSKFDGPLNGMIEWEMRSDSLDYNSALVIDMDNNFYILIDEKSQINNEPSTRLHKYDYNSNLIWKSEILGSSRFDLSTPVVTKNGILCTHYDKTYLIDFDGKTKWEINIAPLGTEETVSIDKTGNIYFVSDKIYSYNYSGNKNWEIERFGGITGRGTSPIDPKEEFIIFTGVGDPEYVFLDLATQNSNWSFGQSPEAAQSPMIDSQSRVYFISESDIRASVFCLNKKGDIIWENKLSQYSLWDIAMSKSGNIIFGALNGIGAIDYNGKLLWDFVFESEEQLYGQITLDNSGNIYIQTTVFYSRKVKISKISPEGKYIWSVDLNTSARWGYPLVITSDNGILYRAFRDNYICKIK